MKVLKNNFLNFFTILLLLVVLFFPVKYFYLYYGLVFLCVFMVCLFSKFKILKSIYLYFFIILSSLVVINSSLSSIYFGSDFFRNITELIRFFPIILIIYNYNNFIIKYSQLYLILAVYVVLASVVNIFQFMKIDFSIRISELYNDPAHIENSLELANRSLGLSSGPGSNGIIFVVLFIFFFVAMISDYYKLKSILLMALSVVSIFCAQSQTAFVALAFILIFIFFDWFQKSYNKKSFYSVFIFFIVLLVGGALYLWNNIKDFKYLNTLFEQGLNRSSYQNREVKLNSTLDLIGENNFFYFIGHGKDYIPSSSALDNEYLFILSVYGLIGLFLICLFYLYNIIFLYFYGWNNIYKYLIVYTCISGLIVAWPSSFLLDPRILFILSLYFVCYLQANKKLNYL